MTIDSELIRLAIESLSEIDGVYMPGASLVEDVVLLAYAFPEPEGFMVACASTRRALELLVEGKVSSSVLKYGYKDWRSFHYQPRVGQGVKATCRIMYRQIDGGIEVKGFGHRRIPADFYRRMGEIRRKR